MQRFSPIVMVMFLVHVCAGAEVKKVMFEGAFPEQKWALAELNPALPADWTGFDFLTLEARASSPQRFELRIYTKQGTRKLRWGPFQGAWCRVSVPLDFLRAAPAAGHDLASLHNRSLPSSFLNVGGGVGPLDAVEAVGVAMEKPIGKPTLEIRNVRLTKGQPEDALLEPKPVVDEFGQWIPAQWPGKAKTLKELQAAWAREEEELQAGKMPALRGPTCKYGGFPETKAKATGFFRVEQIDGKWWLVDPDGHLFFSVGSDCMNSWSSTRTEGREGVFAAQPLADLRPTTPRFRRSSTGRSASFYTWNLVRRFGKDWEKPWIDLTIRRMEAWGLNTIANWSDPRLWDAGRKPYVVILYGWGSETGWLGLPDVYADNFVSNAAANAAEQCAPRKDDPFLIGYFLANEPAWPGREAQAAQMILAGPPTASQRELKAWLAAGDTPQRRREFVYRAFEKYLAVTVAAVRKADPNHLNLGLRFGGRADDELIKMCRVFDVFSMNSYTYRLDEKQIESIYKLTERPIVIGEFHFGVPGRGLSAGLKQTVSQAERGVAYRYYVENAAALPAVIGVHWFQWIDQPTTGRSDGENYNIGLVDVTDRPYAETIEALKETHKRLYAVHAGKEPPVSQEAKVE